MVDICASWVAHILMGGDSNRYAMNVVVVVVVILFPEEDSMIHSIHTTFQQFRKCIPLAVAREAPWLIELTTAMYRQRPDINLQINKSSYPYDHSLLL